MKTILFAGFLSAALAANCFGSKVLILSTTVSDGNNSMEAVAAASMGYQVDIVTPTVWSAMTLNDFKTYQAIILGDPGCRDATSLVAAVANANLWGQAVKGNVIIVGTDPIIHPFPGGSILISNAISFATAQAGKTGLYCCLSCYYWNDAVYTPSVLNGIGAFQGIGIGGCYNLAHIVATSPVMSGLTDTTLSDWGCSVHEGFSSWPLSFVPVAIARGAGTAYTAPDLSTGTPYILASGVGLTPVTSGITLSPPIASNPTNTTHTICAAIAVKSAPAVGATVTFNIISGPNMGVSGQAMTDNSGKACFTYPGVGGVGMDTITASAVDAASQPVVATVLPATKMWFDPCGANQLSVIVEGAICDSNILKLDFNEILPDAEVTNVIYYTLDNGLNVTNVTVDSQVGLRATLQADGNFIPGTPYTVTIANLVDDCGRPLTPNPTVLTFTCKSICPSVLCPSNIVTQCTGPGGATVSFTVSPAPGCSNSVVTFPTSPHLFPVGTNFVTAFGFGAGSNSCTFAVIVNDSLPPVIDCPSNMVINTSCPDNPVYFDVGATDNCCLASIVCTPPSGSPFPIGTTTVNCAAYDCSGNSNTCSFTVTVDQIEDAGLPTILSGPTNIYVCTNDAGCAAMPDVTGDVQATNGEETVFVSQSIPVGTPICSNTNITLTVSNLCGDFTNLSAQVLVGPCDCAPIVTMPWPSAPAKIIVFEGKGPGPETRHEFTLNPFDPGLTNIPGGPTPAYADFDDQDIMEYDVYLSDPDGNYASNGCCVSIVCNNNNASTDFDTGNNIDAVELQFADGTVQAADHIGSVQLGVRG